MKVFLDMDGVLVNFAKGACKFHGVENPYVYGEKNEWNISKVLDIPGPNFWGPLGRHFWSDLEPYTWAPALVRALRKIYGQENLCLLSTPIHTPGCMEGKRDWIVKHFPEFESQFLLGDPKHMAAGPGSLLIDDHGPNVDKFRESGGQAFLFAAPWNRRYLHKDPMEDLLEAIKRADEVRECFGRL